MTLPRCRLLAGLIVFVVPIPALGDLADRYAIDVYKQDKAYAGTTIFGDFTDPKNILIVEIEMTGKVVWYYRVPHDREGPGGMDVEWIPATDNILYTMRSGVYEIDRKGKVVWSYRAPVSHDADRLANGNTLMGWGWGTDSSDPEAREVDPQGKVVWKWHAAEHLKGETRMLDQEGFTHTNSVVRLANGNTLISLRNYYMLVEVAPSGRIVWKLPGLVTTPHDPEILPDGNILVNTRSPQVIKEITPAGQMVWQYRPDQQDVQIVRYNHRLPNGNILFADHTKIIEITPQKEVVWRLRLTQVSHSTADKGRWLYKAERIPAGKAAPEIHAFAAPSETLAKSGQSVMSLEERNREEARRAVRAMFARMDNDGDGRIARAEFTDRGEFDEIDADRDDFISQAEAEATQMKRLTRPAKGKGRSR